MAMVDAVGRLVRFSLIPGNAAEVKEFPPLLDGISTSEVIADRAFDTDAARKFLTDNKIIATIPPKVNRRVKPWYDEGVYELRHFVENRFAVIKQFRGVATRYAKLAEMYAGMVYLAEIYYATRTQAGGRPPGGTPAVTRRMPV